MRRKTAGEILAESFRELAETKKIATFYRHFRDKYDLIAWDYAGRMDQIVSRIGNEDYIWRQALLDVLVY